jgi:hypothetical protein
MLNIIKSLFKPKQSKVKVLITFNEGDQTTVWMTYSGWFNVNSFADQLFEEYPSVKKIKVIDFA